MEELSASDPLVQTVIVSDGPDVADKWIADRASDGDVVVTADIPLARVIANGEMHYDTMVMSSTPRILAYSLQLVI